VSEPNGVLLIQQLATLREQSLPSPWVQEVMSANTEFPPPGELDANLWVTIMFVAAFKRGLIDKASLIETSEELPRALRQTVEVIDEKYPGLLNAPSVVTFVSKDIEGGSTDSDEITATPSKAMDQEQEAMENSVSWYGIRRIETGQMLLFSKDGESLPALQVRLFNSLNAEVFNRLLPFGDALFLANTFFDSIGEAFEIQQMSIKEGKIAENTRKHLAALVSEAEKHINRLKDVLNQVPLS
jgi:hypothetical protein